jgi:hypothetical protein
MLRQRESPLLLQVLLSLAWQLLLQESFHQLVLMQLVCCRTVAAVCHTVTTHAAADGAAEVSAGECAGVVKVAAGVVAGAAVQGVQGLSPLQPAAPLAAFHCCNDTPDDMLETLALILAVMLTLQLVWYCAVDGC